MYWEVVGNHMWRIWGHKIADFDILPYISFIIVFTASECTKRYWETIYMCKVYITCQIYPLTPPLYGSNWGNKIADFVFLPYITFINAFTALECIKRYWETICGESI